MRIAITAFERDMLLKNPETASLGKELCTGELILTGSAEQFEAMREACSELLQRVGFDDSYSPTQEGSALESLIDRLFVE